MNIVSWLLSEKVSLFLESQSYKLVGPNSDIHTQYSASLLQ